MSLKPFKKISKSPEKRQCTFIGDLELAVNYDPPEDPEGCIHRIGHTGRTGGFDSDMLEI
jgi:hypothetical protein